ncbi:MAG: alpha/beta fold hydrolase [Acidimicrobiia bacterium]|nr:alpha/beta fold hydrolase [Acidimicrobiia bacterium]
MTEHTHPPSRFVVPGFAQTAGAWSAVIDLIDDAEGLEIPVARDFAATAGALADGRAGVWGGYSLGGRLALQIAIHHPNRVSALILVSTTPGLVDSAEREDRYRHDRELADWVDAHTVDEFLDRWLVQPVFGGANRPRHHRLDSPAQIAHQLRTLSPGAHPPLWGQLSSLSMPVAIVAGAEDAKYLAIAEAMAAEIGSTAELHVVPGAGHQLLEQAPHTVQSLLLGL